MKNLLLSIATVLFSTVLISCSSTGRTTENNYFGYTNTPDERSYSDGSESNDNWVNPLAENAGGKGEIDDSGNPVYQEVNNYYSTSQYVPVIVPWWNDYYGWSSYSVFGGGYIGSGPYYGYDWYSPWYNYHPYYGYSWYDNYGYGYNSWYNQPYYSNNVSQRSGNSYRNFGSRRGRYSQTGNRRNRNDFASYRNSSRSGTRRGRPGEAHSAVNQRTRSGSNIARGVATSRSTRGRYVNSPSRAVPTSKVSRRSAASSRKSRYAVTGSERNTSTGSNNWKTIYSRSGSRKASDNSSRVSRTNNTRSSGSSYRSRSGSSRPSGSSYRSRSGSSRSSGTRSSGRSRSSGSRRSR